jgi:hypothetical protein
MCPAAMLSVSLTLFTYLSFDFALKALFTLLALFALLDDLAGDLDTDPCRDLDLNEAANSSFAADLFDGDFSSF